MQGSKDCKADKKASSKAGNFGVVLQVAYPKPKKGKESKSKPTK